MDRVRSWEALCRQRTAAQWEQDGACMAITAKIVASLEPTRLEMDRWQRACERAIEVDNRMRRYVAAEFMPDRIPLSTGFAFVSRTLQREGVTAEGAVTPL